jgi:hypothetical protein
MSVYAIVVGILLAGQVGGAGDRYPSPFSTPNPTDAGPRLGSDAASDRNAGSPQAITPSSSQPPNAYSVPMGSSTRDVQPPPASRPMTQSSGSVMGTNSTQPQYGYGNAAPTNSNARPPISNDQDNGPKPSTMMRAMLTPPPGARLSGQPAKLVDVIRTGGSRADQLQRVDAYWDLCSSVADYYLGLREQDELQKLRASVSKVGPTWQQAESELGVRIGTSQHAAVASQYRLASMMGRGGGDSLPLPADLPHCGDYYARFSQVFAGRQSAEGQQLSELLPLRYEELKDAATAVARAQEWLDAIANQRSDASDGTGTLRALELLALRRRAFIQIARDYNRRIARYTELASPGEIGADRLLSMLIKPEGSDNTATRFSSPAPPINRQSQTNKPPATPKTFAEGWEAAKGEGASAITRDESVAPASAEAPSSPHVEHSLLVSPQ